MSVLYVSNISACSFILSQGAFVVDKITVLGFSLKEEMEEEQDLNKKIYKDVLIEAMDFSLRTYNLLKRAGISSSGELAIFSNEELLEIKELGKGALKEIQEKMALLEITEEEEGIDDIEKDKKVVNIAIEDLGLTSRVCNYFKRLNINTTEDLSKYTVEELLDMKGLGRQTVKGLVNTLGKLGVRLATPTKDNEEKAIENSNLKKSKNKKRLIVKKEDNVEIVKEEKEDNQEEIREMSRLQKLKNKKRAMEDSIKSMENTLNEAKALLEHYNRLIRNIEQKENSQFGEFE